MQIQGRGGGANKSFTETSFFYSCAKFTYGLDALTTRLMQIVSTALEYVIFWKRDGSAHYEALTIYTGLVVSVYDQGVKLAQLDKVSFSDKSIRQM